MKWEGTVQGTFSGEFEVEADTEEEAIAKATSEWVWGVGDIDSIEVDTIYAEEDE